ncbi:hypothetical protein SDJN02_03083, partial [Cucurbita argyrosperma subsp. argyrosperma]
MRPIVYTSVIRFFSCRESLRPRLKCWSAATDKNYEHAESPVAKLRANDIGTMCGKLEVGNG